MTLFHAPGVEILWTSHMSRVGDRPAVDAAVDPDHFLRLTFAARYADGGINTSYVATMTLISRDSGRVYHYNVPWRHQVELRQHDVMFQLFWSRAADATRGEPGLFLFQPTLILIVQGSAYDEGGTEVGFWEGASRYAVAPEPHYLLMEGLPRLPYPNPYAQ